MSDFLTIKKLTIKNNEDTIYKWYIKTWKITYLNKKAYEHKHQNWPYFISVSCKQIRNAYHVLAKSLTYADPSITRYHIRMICTYFLQLLDKKWKQKKSVLCMQLIGFTNSVHTAKQEPNIHPSTIHNIRSTYTWR